MCIRSALGINLTPGMPGYKQVKNPKGGWDNILLSDEEKQRIADYRATLQKGKAPQEGRRLAAVGG